MPCASPVELTCAGRTDAGVHAWGQVVSLRRLRLRPSVDLARLVKRVNSQLRPGGRGPRRRGRRRLRRPPRRHARRYRYTILNAPVPDPFLARTAWWVPEPLDLRAMQAGVRPAPRRARLRVVLPAPEPVGRARVPRTMRRVDDAEWVDRRRRRAALQIEANAFCHQMVRSIVGLLVDVGRGRRTGADVPPRPARRATAPPPPNPRRPTASASGRLRVLSVPRTRQSTSAGSLSAVRASTISCGGRGRGSRG